MKFVRAIGAAIVGAVVALPLTAAVTAIPAAAAEEVSAQDRAWLIAAHQSNLTEIAAGEAARAKATTVDVRDHGEMFVADHTRLDNDLRALADELQVSLPSEPTAEQQATLDRVSALSGPAFDDEWIRTQIVSHRQSRTDGERELANGDNPQVVDAAEAAAPVIASHLEMLLSSADGRSIDTGMGAPAGSEPPTVGWGLLAGGAAAAGIAVLRLRRRVPAAATRP